MHRAGRHTCIGRNGPTENPVAAQASDAPGVMQSDDGCHANEGRWVRNRIVPIALAALAALTTAAVFEWRADTARAPGNRGTQVPERELPAVRPQVAEVSAVQPHSLLEPATAPGPAAVTPQTPTPAPDGQPNDPEGTASSPGDPLVQPENATEQFMHSRRGDGQHSE
jgi:hypothetical protein